MEMKKKAMFDITSMVVSLIVGIIGVVIILAMVSPMWGVTAGGLGNASATADLPLGSLYSKSGPIAILFGAIFVVAAIVLMIRLFKSK